MSTTEGRILDSDSPYIRSIDRTRARAKTPMKIGLFDFKYYYATMLYQRTKDILYVKEQMGHKRIENTLIYTRLIRFSEEEYVSAVAKTVDDARKLVEAGFEYVTEMDGLKLFKKRK